MYDLMHYAIDRPRNAFWEDNWRMTIITILNTKEVIIYGLYNLLDYTKLTWEYWATDGSWNYAFV